MTSTPGRLRWAVKKSFIDYIRGLDDGAIEVFDGAEHLGETFVFTGESSDDSGLLFGGGIRFTGFAGMLDVRLVDPMIETSQKGDYTLTAMVGAASIAARAPIATISGAGDFRPGQPWSAVPQLTFQGVRIFGDVYQVGADLAPLVVEPEPM
jgi:hypothetical protein